MLGGSRDQADDPLEDWIWVEDGSLSVHSPAGPPGDNELHVENGNRPSHSTTSVSSEAPPTLGSGRRASWANNVANAGDPRPHTVYASESDCPYLITKRLGHEQGCIVLAVRNKDQPWKQYMQKKGVASEERDQANLNNKLRAEASLLRELHHEHVVKVAETFESAGHFNILLAPRAALRLTHVFRLFDAENNPHRQKPSLETLKEWVSCLTKALTYLHNQNVEHGDIQPSNIMITVDDRVLLTGFAMARRVDRSNPADTAGTTASPAHQAASPYAAPSHPGPHVPFKDDMYGFGCVLLELVTAICHAGDGGDSQAHFRHVRAGAPGNDPAGAYAPCQKQLVQWISTLSTMGPLPVAPPGCNNSSSVDAADWTRITTDLAFRMLDPSPACRPAAALVLQAIRWFGVDGGASCLCEGGGSFSTSHSSGSGSGSAGLEADGSGSTTTMRLEEDRWAAPLWAPLLYNLEAVQYWDLDIPVSPWEIAKHVCADGVTDNAVIQGILQRAAARANNAFRVGGPPRSYFLGQSTSLPDHGRGRLMMSSPHVELALASDCIDSF
ncbi:putative dual specificity mitogen-activated protein kinase kinase 1 protein [Lasiodiplodia theobromae]|nr:putative dual specificity mitogen-activated protein kinase kinase 1 protein [Lasiodiplodia theobromae]